MPELKRVLPALASNKKFQGSSAYRFIEHQVTAIKLTTGAPCSTHGELFARWPGPESNIVEWYVLENGYAVGKGVDSRGEEYYPVVQLETS